MWKGEAVCAGRVPGVVVAPEATGLFPQVFGKRSTQKAQIDLLALLAGYRIWWGRTIGERRTQDRRGTGQLGVFTKEKVSP